MKNGSITKFQRLKSDLIEITRMSPYQLGTEMGRPLNQKTLNYEIETLITDSMKFIVFLVKSKDSQL